MEKETKYDLNTLDPIKELEDGVNALIEENERLRGEKDEPESEKFDPAQRKMRFAADDFEDMRGKMFQEKRDPTKYGLEEIALARLLLGARGSELPTKVEDKFQALAGDRIRKFTMTTGGTGTGAELTDTLMWDRLFKDVVSQTLVAGLFQPWVDMQAGKVELPSMGDVTFYKPAGEGQAVTATDLATKKVTITAYTAKAQVDVSDEESEDAVINVIPEIRTILVRNAREVIDELILNADASTGTQNINYYAATGGSNIATDSRFLLDFDGLIHYCLNEVTGQKTDLGTLETADFGTLISLLGKYGDTPSRLAFVMDRWVKNKAIQLDDFRTVDKLGDQATLLRGQMGQVYGVPVVMSGQLAKSNATGQVDQTAENNTKGRLLLVNRDMWRFGVRRNIRVAVQRDEPKTLTSIVVTMRIGLQCYGDRSDASYSHVALGYNVTV